MNSHSLIRNHQGLIARFGGWPAFNDAEVISFLMHRASPTKKGSASASLRLNVRGQLVSFSFTGISQVDLSGFNDQNVIDGLVFSQQHGLIKVDLEHCFGLSGSFLCETAEVTP